MEKTMTAVQWLEERYKKNINLMPSDFEQAKAMEQYQIVDAFHINPLESKFQNIGLDYYAKTYNPSEPI